MANTGPAGGTAPPDMVGALTTMANRVVERQVELMRDLMGCGDPVAAARVTSEWTERSITGFINDHARVMEATAAQMDRFIRTPLQ